MFARTGKCAQRRVRAVRGLGPFDQRPAPAFDARFEKALLQNAKEDQASSFSKNREEKHGEWWMKRYGDEISAACDWYTQQ
jgi:hypothetical protein